MSYTRRRCWVRNGLALVLLVAGSPACKSSDAPTTAVSHFRSKDKERTQELVRALDSTNTNVRSRAIRELGWNADQDNEALRALVGLLTRPGTLDEQGERELVQALSRAKGQPRADAIETICRATPGPESVDRVLRIIGRWQCDGESVAPFLLKLQRDYRDDALTSGRVMVLLLRYQEIKERQVTGIIAEVKGRTESGQGALSMLADIGWASWMGQKVKGMLEELLKEDRGESSPYAAVALSQCGEYLKDGVKDQLRALAARHRDSKDEASYVVYAICYARAAQGTRGQYLRDLAARAGRNLGGHPDADAIELAWPAFTDEMGGICLQMVDNKDPDVARGAIILSYYLGLRPEELARKLLGKLEANRNEGIREESAIGLRWCAPLSFLPRLRAILDSAPSKDVHGALADTLLVINLAPGDRSSSGVSNVP